MVVSVLIARHCPLSLVFLITYPQPFSLFSSSFLFLFLSLFFFLFCCLALSLSLSLFRCLLSLLNYHVLLSFLLKTYSWFRAGPSTSLVFTYIFRTNFVWLLCLLSSRSVSSYYLLLCLTGSRRSFTSLHNLLLSLRNSLSLSLQAAVYFLLHLHPTVATLT